MIISKKFFKQLINYSPFDNVSYLLDADHLRDKKVYIKLIYEDDCLIDVKLINPKFLFEMDDSFFKLNEDGEITIEGLGKGDFLSKDNILIIE